MDKLVLAVLVVFLATLTACGGGSMASTNPPPPPPPSTVSATVTLNNATTGSFDVAMSTSFQPAEWDYQFFRNFPSATTPLSALVPHHIRLQGISHGVPQGAEGTSSTAWDFTILDAITQLVLGVGDRSPEFQIAKAPAFMYVNDDSSNSFNDPNYTQFAAYAQNLVRYYNKGGFTPTGGSLLVSPSYPTDKITWWGIYNEPSINNNLTATEYTQMYNALVPAMQAVDPNVKFVGIELCCSSENWVRTFASDVTAQVDAVASHYYSSCNQRDTDTQVFATVPGFASSIQTIYGSLAANPALANVPVWITENNVNADFDKGGGISACTGLPFVTDLRGSSAFFAAWRPYAFSQVGKAGARTLYHWDFDADAQFGEVDYNTGQTQLSYWVDYWLGQMFPAGSGQRVLQFSNTDNAEIEVLPVLNTDGSAVIMISNHAVASASDNNGEGLTANVSVDVSALGPFTTASLFTIDSTTSAINGPGPAASISPSSPIKVTVNGYGVAFLSLK
jgi:hypothetical protein